MRPAFDLTLRPSAPSDVATIATIYAHYVRFGRGTFEEAPPAATEMARRREEVLARGLPYLVAADGEGRVLGYAYAAPYRTRSAWRFTVEDSIYVAPERLRRGIGSRLLGALVEHCAAADYRQMVAVIGDSENHASIGLHEGLGFRRIGLQTAVGFKHGRWIDSVLMQRPLGPGASTDPIAAGR